MATIALFTDRELLTAGIAHAVSDRHRIEAHPVDTFSDLIGEDAPHPRQFDAAILDLPPDAPDTTCFRLDTPNLPLIAWFRVRAIEPSLVALRTGFKGVFFDSNPLADAPVCIDKVLAGNVWVPTDIAQAAICNRPQRLTVREGQLAQLVAHGLSNKEIAYRLNIASGTVKVYLSRLFDKLKVSDRYELALLMLKHTGFLPVSQSTPSLRSPARIEIFTHEGNFGTTRTPREVRWS